MRAEGLAALPALETIELTPANVETVLDEASGPERPPSPAAHSRALLPLSQRAPAARRCLNPTHVGPARRFGRI